MCTNNVFFFEGEGSCFSMKCQRTRDYVWEWRWGWSERTGKDSVKIRAFFIEGPLLLDVILTDENQEEGTSLHLPALLDKLQGILRTHGDTHTYQRSFVCFLRVKVKTWDEIIFHTILKWTPYRSYPGGLLSWVWEVSYPYHMFCGVP